MHYSHMTRYCIHIIADRWRVNLRKEYNSYLHAIHVNGYKDKKVFLIAQTPMAPTIRNLWKVIYDSEVAVIIQLTDMRENGEEVCAQYWPSRKGEVQQWKEYSVDLVNQQEHPGYIVRTLSVFEQSVSDLISYTNCS